eukprot:10258347-Prorocentrum_lima.AAC.1
MHLRIAVAIWIGVVHVHGVDIGQLPNIVIVMGIDVPRVRILLVLDPSRLEATSFYLCIFPIMLLEGREEEVALILGGPPLTLSMCVEMKLSTVDENHNECLSLAWHSCRISSKP